jgi:hypothetical protein
MLVLQSCTDPLHILPGSSSETYATSRNIASVKVEESVVKEDVFISINEEVDLGIKQEEIPEDTTFRDKNAEPDEVSYVCLCLLLGTFYHYPEMSIVFVTSIVLVT